MVRTIVGVIITLVCFVVAPADPALWIAAAVISGVWVLLGIGSVIRAATDKPSEHHVQVRGAVAHVVIDDRAPAPMSGRPSLPSAPSAPKRLPPRKIVIECPRCSMHVFPEAAACVCGWQVSEASQGAVIRKVRDQPVDDVPVVERAAKQPPRVCPACPACRAPTAWVSEFDRFFCSRCDAYLERNP